MCVKKKLVELLDTHCDYAGHVDCQDDCTKCLADHLISNGVTVQTWISVKDKRPQQSDGKVLAFTHFGFSICRVRDDGILSGMHANWITHWMPLPEPPKEG